MLDEQTNISLHPSFSVKDFTFLSKDKGVVYCPVNGETLLCETSVIHYLTLLESKPECSYRQLMKMYPTQAENMIQQLANLYVIEIQGKNIQNDNN
ncbi:hypothetical protein [Vibrio ziniensis]|uniref:PqqD family protein n=1 Tax=Vibrio ziniensis TaxID=2711221 RepID=A0A6G7CMJ3_9VIBR|nr:hypothetical protein [Vibrio ziniensis]QIH43315.1 hypothetical protein G5S32_15015 [Vibrio ziniensis]